MSLFAIQMYSQRANQWMTILCTYADEAEARAKVNEEWGEGQFKAETFIKVCETNQPVAMEV